MHQFSLNATLERITDQTAAASIPHDKKNSITDERASSRRSLLAVEEWCLRGCSQYLRERASARGSSCSARDFDKGTRRGGSSDDGGGRHHSHSVFWGVFFGINFLTVGYQSIKYILIDLLNAQAIMFGGNISHKQ
jgi:hypothetical protein